MSEIIGKRVICDRCKKEVFLKYLKEEDRDGGFSKIQFYEKLPEGWKHWAGYTTTRCPECDTLYMKMEKNFWKGEDSAI